MPHTKFRAIVFRNFRTVSERFSNDKVDLEATMIIEKIFKTDYAISVVNCAHEKRAERVVKVL